jgi:hypothetical protein
VSARFLVTPLAERLGLPPADALLSLGCTPAATQRYLIRGLPTGAAQVLADEAGLDPRQVWPDWDQAQEAAAQDRALRTAGITSIERRAHRRPRPWEMAQ